MDRQTAVKIIKETFESPFEKEHFVNLCKNLFKTLDSSKNFTYQGNIIPDAYEQSIQNLERVGKYEDADDNKIDILIVRLKKEQSLERARTMQRNFVAWYLNGSRGGELKDAALVAFVSPESLDWRFSLVRMDYNIGQSPSGRVKVEKELTPARRYSFLVGEHESSHTAQIQLLPILQDDEQKPQLSDFEKAFNIEIVTREFFTKYRELFHDVEEALENAMKQDSKAKKALEVDGVDTVNFAKKLLGQIVFLYFLQKKGWLGVPEDKKWGDGDRRFLRSLFDRATERKKTSLMNTWNTFSMMLWPDRKGEQLTRHITHVSIVRFLSSMAVCSTLSTITIGCTMISSSPTNFFLTMTKRMRAISGPASWMSLTVITSPLKKTNLWIKR